MCTVVSLPEKRHDFGLDPIPEKPPEKRPKLDDPAMELQRESQSASATLTRREFKTYCEICHGNVGHKSRECPNKSQGMGMGCPYCYGPCKKKDDDPREHWSIEMVKYCVECGNMGNHWVDECPWLRLQAELDDSSETDFEELMSNMNYNPFG